MYGYIQICKPELKFREFDEYRTYYCGLCHSLKEHFGSAGQFFLSYDLTFLALLLDSLYEPQSVKHKSRCIAHPIKKQDYIKSEVTEYSADMCLLLASYKLEDDWKDDGSLFKKTAKLLISGKTNILREKYTKKIKIIEEELDKLQDLEKENCKNPELTASCFGRILSEILVYKEDIWMEALGDLGFHLGKFIYISDAFDDLSKDKKKHRYNPFIDQNEHDPDFIDSVEELLRIMIAPAASAFEYLPIIKNADILRNILYAGVWTAFRKRKNEYLNEEKTKNKEEPDERSL